MLSMKIPTSTFPRSKFSESIFRIAVSKSLYGEAILSDKSKPLLFKERISTETFFDSKTPFDFPKPVIDNNIVKFYVKVGNCK